MNKLLSTMIVLVLSSSALAQEPLQPPQMMPLPPVTPRAPVEIVMAPAQGTAAPCKKGVAFANGGAIEVRQVDPTTVVVTMSGLTATNADLLSQSVANYSFELQQEFDIVFNSDRVKSAKLQMEGQVMGLLRSDHSQYTCRVCDTSGAAATQPAVAAVVSGTNPMVSMVLPGRATSGRQDLSITNRETAAASVPAGHFTLHQTWGFGTSHPAFVTRGASAEFSPQPQYFPDMYWFQSFRPFNGAATSDFGFKVTIKVIPE